MKISKNIITIALVSSFTFISCLKKGNIYYENEDYLYNNTNDTLIFKLTENIDSSIYKFTLYPNQKCGYFRHFLYNDSKIEIYKYDDTNTLFIGFYEDVDPFNYKKNVYDFPSAWNKDTIISWYLVKYSYSFPVTCDDIINN